MPRIVHWRKLRFRFDWTLTAAILALMALGLINLWSAVRDRQFGLFAQQISWLALGGLVFLVVASFDYRQIARLGYLLYAAGAALLLAVLLAGKVVAGSRRWFDLGPMHLQPSEPMKVLLIIALAKYINDRPAPEGRTLRHLFIPLVLAAIPVVLIAAQPDFSTAVLCLVVCLTMMLIARLDLKTFGGMMGLAVLAAAPFWEYVLHDYQKNRILALIDPALNPASAWQPQQAMNAIGSGRFLGKGFLQGTQIRVRALPALWTDFPFAVWAEEWGFLGGLVVLAAYGFLIVWAVKIGREARDRFGMALCLGCAALLFWQVTINIGMVSGLLPVMGVTLPLISYGGSSVITTMIALGLVMNVSVRRYAY